MNRSRGPEVQLPKRYVARIACPHGVGRRHIRPRGQQPSGALTGRNAAAGVIGRSGSRRCRRALPTRVGESRWKHRHPRVRLSTRPFEFLRRACRRCPTNRRCRPTTVTNDFRFATYTYPKTPINDFYTTVILVAASLGSARRSGPVRGERPLRPPTCIDRESAVLKAARVQICGHSRDRPAAATLFCRPPSGPTH